MQQRSIFGLLIVSLMLVAFVAPMVSAEGEAIVNFVSQPVIKQIFGVVFGIWDTANLDNLVNTWGIRPTGTGVSVLIVYIMLWLILFVAFSDIVVVFAPFSKPMIGWIIGAALTIIAAQLQFVFTLASWAAVILAYFGTFSVFVGIAFAFVAFIAASIGSEWLREWVVGRKIAMLKTRAAEGSAEAKEGLKFLKELGHDISK